MLKQWRNDLKYISQSISLQLSDALQESGYNCYDEAVER